MFVHVALEVTDKNKAEIFFSQVLNIPKTGDFVINKNLCKDIFGIEKETEVIKFKKGILEFEVFVTCRRGFNTYSHVCLNVDDKNEVIKRCEKLGVKTIIVKKGCKELLFVKDFSGNLFEIKEKI